ncbi:MAG: class I SAM-dependent methyltransferase [Cyanobacteriota bacterium]|nr:class I SAM-dependent methyltransferase [Cyanobacteriota bacterium]
MSRLEIDFDGDYGRSYDATIRTLIPAYEAIMEIAAASLRALVPEASTVLVVGAGSGSELPPMLAALPQAHFSLVEPSGQMRSFCQRVIAAAQAVDRVQWGPERLEPDQSWGHEAFDVVVSHNVLHLMPPSEQQDLLMLMLACIRPGGLLLLSSYSEPDDPQLLQRVQAIATARFAAAGLTAERIAAVLASRNNGVFSLDQDALDQALERSGMEPTTLLAQALLNRLWCSRKPKAAAS